MIKVQNQIHRLQNFITGFFYFSLKMILSFLLGFLASKSEIFLNLSPFSIILLSISPELGLISSGTYAGSAIGLLSQPIEISVFKYITAITFLYIYHMAFERNKTSNSKNAPFIASLSCFISGVIFLIVEKITLLKILLLFCECILIFCCVYFSAYAGNAFKRESLLTSREIIATSITYVLLIVILKEITFFQLNVARLFGIIAVLLALTVLKQNYSTLLGITTAIVISVISQDKEAIFIAMITATIAAVISSHFSRKLISTAFALGYYVVLFLYGKFPWSYWLFGELLLSYCIVSVIPKKKIQKLIHRYIPTYSTANQANEQFKKCKNECASNCPNFKKCYQKNTTLIKELLLKFTEETIETIELEFCNNPQIMRTNIRKVYSISQEENIDQIINELGIISKEFEKIKSCVPTLQALEKEEYEIKKQLAKRKVNVRDISFTQNRAKKKSCTLVFESNEEVLYQKIIRETVSPFFECPITIHCIEQNELITAKIKEQSNYKLSCAALAKTKNENDYSGDSAIGFSDECNHYYLILADGMGSGKNARIQSEAIINLFHNALSNGIAVASAIHLYRSLSRFHNSFSFTTLDICSVDLQNGRVDFFKAGAYSSFHISDNRIIQLSGGGLPIGLSENDRVIHKSFQLGQEDYIIMSSDGLIAIEDSITTVLENAKNENVRLFAKNILHSVSKSNNMSDDVTVMVCKITKNA